MSNPNVIEFECPRCLEIVRASRDQAGQRIDCPACQGSLLVPAQSAAKDMFDDIFSSEPAEEGSADSPSDPQSRSTEQPGAPDHTDVLNIEDDEVLEQSEPSEGELPEDELLDDEDLMQGLDVMPEEADIRHSGAAAEDPFVVDPDAPIKVDGIGDLYSHADVYGIKCNVCDTRIHVRPDQIDTQIECPECYSKILVTPPKQEKPAQRWVKEGRGNFVKHNVDDDDELRLSEPVKRPKTESLSADYGLEPVQEDLLAPKPRKVETPSESPDTDSTLQDAVEPPFSEIVDESTPTLAPLEGDAGNSEFDILDDLPDLADEGSELSRPSQREVPTLPNVANKKPVPRPSEKSRREKLEEAQRRQEAAEKGPAFRSPETESVDKDFPDFDFVSLLNAVKTMLLSPGLPLRAAIAIGLMCLGTIMMQLIWPDYVPVPEAGEEVAPKSLIERLMMFFQWSLVGLLPYLAGLAMLWFSCSYLFRDAALGNRQVLSWKNAGGVSELKATFLLFSFAFFIGGLPMPPIKPFVYLILPLRFMLGTLFLLSAWKSQAAFSIVNVDAFKNMSGQISQWSRYYGFVLGLAGIAFVAGMIFWMRGVIPIFVGTAFVSVIAVSLMALATLAFAPVCGWHCGLIVEEQERAE